MIADNVGVMIEDMFGWLLVAYLAGLALWFAGGLAWDAFQWMWDDLIPSVQGRRARATRAAQTVQRSAIPRRIDLRDSEAVDVWLDRRGLA